VTFVHSKSSKRYKVPINDTALAAFKKLGERCDGTTGSVMRKPRPRKTNAEGRGLQSYRKWFEKSLAEAKIQDFTWHDLRHIFGTRLRAAKVPLEDIQYLMGHGGKNITLRYAEPDMKSLREYPNPNRYKNRYTHCFAVSGCDWSTIDVAEPAGFELVDEKGFEPSASSLRTRPQI
jgi:integrase